MTDSKSLIKEGDIIVKSGILKQKHKRWCQLYQDSNGQVILECFENREQKDKVKNSFVLNSVKNLDKVVKDSSKDYYIDVHLKREKFSLIFSSQSETDSWYYSLQNNIEICGDGREDSCVSFGEDESGLKDNILYDTQPEEASRFDVSLKPNEDTEKHNLNGKYRLHVTALNLMLEDLKTQEAKFTWYYEHLRKYGGAKTKNEFTIVAGRRSQSGEGTFVFLCEDASKITKAIDRLTKRKHEEQITAKLFSQDGDSERPVSISRSSDPVRQTEISPVPQRKGTSLKEKEEIAPKSPLIRQQSANISSNFKLELAETVNKSKTFNDKSLKSRKEKQEIKDDKKKVFGFFKKDKKTKDKNEQESEKNEKVWVPNPKESLYDEPETVADVIKTPSEPIYEEADQEPAKNRKRLLSNEKKPLKPPEPVLYAQANPDRQNAWKNHGMLEEEHQENYAGIKAAASQRGQRKSVGKKDNDSDDMDDTYDHAFLTQKNLKKKTEPSNSKNIYGTSSGKDIDTPEPDYEENAYELGDDEEEPCEYDDAVSTQRRVVSDKIEAYEDVDLKS